MKPLFNHVTLCFFWLMTKFVMINSNTDESADLQTDSSIPKKFLKNGSSKNIKTWCVIHFLQQLRSENGQGSKIEWNGVMERIGLNELGFGIQGSHNFNLLGFQGFKHRCLIYIQSELHTCYHPYISSHSRWVIQHFFCFVSLFYVY